jgi:hypothetical protein
MKTTKTYKTSYYKAINYFHSNIILCNNITEIDNSIFENQRFNEDLENYSSAYMYYITDLAADEVEFIEKHFTDILFTYSNLLDCFVLCYQFCGASWHGVAVNTDIERCEDNTVI